MNWVQARGFLGLVIGSYRPISAIGASEEPKSALCRRTEAEIECGTAGRPERPVSLTAQYDRCSPLTGQDTIQRLSSPDGRRRRPVRCNDGLGNRYRRSVARRPMGAIELKYPKRMQWDFVCPPMLIDERTISNVVLGPMLRLLSQAVVKVTKPLDFDLNLNAEHFMVMMIVKSPYRPFYHGVMGFAVPEHPGPLPKHDSNRGGNFYRGHLLQNFVMQLFVVLDGSKSMVFPECFRLWRIEPNMQTQINPKFLVVL